MAIMISLVSANNCAGVEAAGLSVPPAPAKESVLDAHVRPMNQQVISRKVT